MTAARGPGGSRLERGLAAIRASIGRRLVAALRRGPGEDAYEELEESLIAADAGVTEARRIVGEVREAARRRPADARDLRELVAEAIAARLGEAAAPLARAPSGPTVIMFFGVNGSGKTTTLAKLAHGLAAAGHRVVAAAGDTFRAGAVAQLQQWAVRGGFHVVAQGAGADPAAVVFDACRAALGRGFDYLLVDTAGRLPTRANLMAELAKMARVAGRVVPGAPHEGLLVLDATTGLNGLRQAQAFAAAVPVTGIVLAKLDGTAKGGVVLPIVREFGVPVKLAGVGEDADDLVPFDPRAFGRALAGLDPLDTA